jgi:hypothetical protein
MNLERMSISKPGTEVAKRTHDDYSPGANGPAAISAPCLMSPILPTRRGRAESCPVAPSGRYRSQTVGRFVLFECREWSRVMTNPTYPP